MADPLSITKISAIVTNFALIIIMGLLPFSSSKFRENPKYLSYTNAFSGGLFLSIGIIHLLAEA